MCAEDQRIRTRQPTYIPTAPRSRFLNPYLSGSCRSSLQSCDQAPIKDLRKLPAWRRFTILKTQSDVEQELHAGIKQRNTYKKQERKIRKAIRILQKAQAEKRRKIREQTRVIRDDRRRLQEDSSDEDEGNNTEEDADGEMSED